MENNYKILTCFHCGNTGRLKIEHIHNYNFGGPIYDTNHIVIDYEPLEKYRWYMLSCPVCHKVSFYEECDDELCKQTFSKTLYPQIKSNLSGIPENIKTAYESALKVKNIDFAICLLSLRRLLEAICKDKNAEGSTLYEMTNDLISKKVLPEMFEDACWIIRELGNSAAHAENRKFYQGQVNCTLRYITTILEYLYILPNDIKDTRYILELEKSAQKKIKETKN